MDYMLRLQSIIDSTLNDQLTPIDTDKSSMKEVTELKVKDYELDCPHCGGTEEGFVGDCRGEVINCDSCGEDYKVSEHSDFEML